MGGIAPPRRQAAAAAVGGYAPVLIDERNPVAAAQITFSSIPQTFQNLLVEAWLKTSTAAISEELTWWVNNNTNVASYYLQDVYPHAGVMHVGDAGNNNGIGRVTGTLRDLVVYNRILIPSYTTPTPENHVGRSEYYWVQASNDMYQIWRQATSQGGAPVTRLDFQATGLLTGKIRLCGLP